MPVENHSWGGVGNENNEHVMHTIRAFWQTLHCRFPHVSHIILSESCAALVPAPLPSDLTRLAESSPSGLNISISYLDQEGSQDIQKRRLWRRVRGTQDMEVQKWVLVSQSWALTRTLPPLKSFSGPVGAYCLCKYYMEKL